MESIADSAAEATGSGQGPIVQADDLRLWYEVPTRLFRPPVHVKAVDGVTLSLHRGRTTALVGESGCGKTTLGRTLVRLLEPTDGQLLFDGQDITHLPEKHLKWLRRKAQLIPQDPYSSLNPAFTVEKILSEPLVVQHIGTPQDRLERVSNALEDVKLTPADVFVRKYPHMLSGGQRQRVAVARAAIMEPELIVADEPVSMLDASVRVSILNLLGDLQKKYNIAFAYITHDLATARHFSDSVGIMYAGNLVELGPVGGIVAEPLHPYTKALMDALPDPDPENRMRDRPAVPGEPPNLISPPPGCTFHPRCPIAKAGLCDIEVPQLRELRPGHLVACHLAE